MSNKKLTLGKKMICGVCSGLANYFNIDPTIVRVAYAIFTIITGFVLGIVVYLIIYLIIENA